METVVMDLRSTLSQTGSNPGSETPPRPVHPAHSVAGENVTRVQDTGLVFSM